MRSLGPFIDRHPPHLQLLPHSARCCCRLHRGMSSCDGSLDLWGANRRAAPVVVGVGTSFRTSTCIANSTSPCSTTAPPESPLGVGGEDGARHQAGRRILLEEAVESDAAAQQRGVGTSELQGG